MIAGSSTVEPISIGMEKQINTDCPEFELAVEGGGSSTGAGRVCNDGKYPALSDKNPSEVDIGNMSRDWKDSEVTKNDDGTYTCLIGLDGQPKRSGVQILVALDGLTVATAIGSNANACAQKLGGFTLEQLRWIFTNFEDEKLDVLPENSDGDTATHKWIELNVCHIICCISLHNLSLTNISFTLIFQADCADEEIEISGAGDVSGTYDFFFEFAFKEFGTGKPELPREGYFGSEDDNEIVEFLESKTNAIGFFGFAFYAGFADELVAEPIKNKDGNYVTPNIQTILDNSYNPYARPLYMNLWDNVDALSMSGPFLRLTLSQIGQATVNGVGYVQITTNEINEMYARVNKAQATTEPVSPPPGSEPVDIPVTPPVAAPTRGPCFSANAEVEVAGVGAVRMDSLKIGDSILTSNNSYSKVYSFGHYSPEDEQDVIEIRTTNMEKPLEISDKHMLLVNGNLSPASSVKVGDNLVSVDGIDVEVKSVRVLTGVKGIYAPHTVEGTLVVNGVVASNYVVLPALDGASFEFQALLQHAAMGPYRMYCSVVGCENETYNVNGLPAAVTVWFPILDALTFVLSNMSTVVVAMVGLYVYTQSIKTTSVEKSIKA